METVRLRPAADRIDYVEDLLDRVGLPTDDVVGKSECFSVAVAVPEGSPVGVGGVEVHGDHALLRSVAVEPDARGQGVGTTICDGLERRATEAGVERLFLLTTTAADFFADRGYDRVARTDAPPAIRETPEFASLCPESATAMCRSVD